MSQVFVVLVANIHAEDAAGLVDLRWRAFVRRGFGAGLLSFRILRCIRVVARFGPGGQSQAEQSGHPRRYFSALYLHRTCLCLWLIFRLVIPGNPPDSQIPSARPAAGASSVLGNQISIISMADAKGCRLGLTATHAFGYSGTEIATQ